MLSAHARANEYRNHRTHQSMSSRTRDLDPTEPLLERTWTQPSRYWERGHCVAALRFKHRALYRLQRVFVEALDDEEIWPATSCSSSSSHCSA